MIKLIISFLMLFLILFAGCSVESVEVSSEKSDCPRGEIDCEYPGSCGKYIDRDENMVCDQSE